MIRSITLALFIIFNIACLVSCTSSPEKEQKKDPPTITKLMHETEAFSLLLETLYEQHPEIKGAILHVEAPDQGISWVGAVGLADSNGRTLEIHVPVLIASVTKTYMAAAILRLEEMGLLRLDDPIAKHIGPESAALLRSDGYALDDITVAHLLTNTSGIYDYVNTERFQNTTVQEPSHVWTRNEQMALAVEQGEPVSAPGEHFSYSDTGFLLLGEILEKHTGKPLQRAVRELLRFDSLRLKNTWWHILERAPSHCPPLAQQYATTIGVNSYSLHGSADMFGGGGLAATCTDMTRFSQYLFEGRLFDDPTTAEKMFIKVETQDSIPPKYMLGLSEMQAGEFVTYGHGGFWGTTMRYVPELNASVGVFLLERDAWQLYNELIADVLTHLKESRTGGPK